MASAGERGASDTLLSLPELILWRRTHHDPRTWERGADDDRRSLRPAGRALYRRRGGPPAHRPRPCPRGSRSGMAAGAAPGRPPGVAARDGHHGGGLGLPRRGLALRTARPGPAGAGDRVAVHPAAPSVLAALPGVGSGVGRRPAH